MGKVWKALRKGIDKISVFLAIISGIASIGIMAILAVNVIARLAVGKGIIGADELAALIVLFCAYLSISYTHMKGRHMQVSAFYDKYKPVPKAIMNIVINALILFFFIMMTNSAIQAFINSIVKMETVSSAMVIYRWPGRLAILVGCLVMLVSTVIAIGENIGALVVLGKGSGAQPTSTSEES